MKTSKKVGLGVGLAAAAAAAAAGAYFLYGKNGAKNRRMVKSWMLKARADVMDKMEKLEHVSEARYREIVDTVLKGYKGMRNVSPAELAAAAAELKGHWSSIQKSFKGGAARKGAKRSGAANKAKSRKARA